MAMNISALKSRDFRAYMSGNIFALNGYWIQRITIGWLAWDLTGSAAFVGLVAFLNYAPTMFLGPFFGVFADRVRLKPIAVLAQSSLLVSACLLLTVYLAGWLGPELLLIFAILAGAIDAAYSPVRMSLAPRLVAKADVASVISLAAVNFNLARLTGPALGGLMIAHWGVGAALTLQALCCLPFVLALTTLNPRPRANEASKPEPFLMAMREGLGHTFRTPLIRQAVLLTGINAFVVRGVLEILPVLADGVFDRGAPGLGLLTSAAGAGALLAGLSKAFLPAQMGGRLPIHAVLTAVLGTMVVAALGLTGSWPVALGLVALLGFVATNTGVSMQTAIQIGLADELRGRVMSLWIMVGIGAAAIGAVVSGGMAEWIGLERTLIFTSLAGLAMMVPVLRDVWRR
ncbi:MAG: MFS transporter [Proteobacteria bacterium]|nr:MFS transporter [Pseudomonadota bacterium]MDA1287547.1 MFS transporter [Pseudomonadota bacterium]